MTPSPAKIDAGCKAAREQLTAISGWINYNTQITDEQMRTFISAVLTSALKAKD